MRDGSLSLSSLGDRPPIRSTAAGDEMSDETRKDFDVKSGSLGSVSILVDENDVFVSVPYVFPGCLVIASLSIL